jgi:hypothetical protein
MSSTPIDDAVKYVIGLGVLVIGYFLKDTMARINYQEEVALKDRESIVLLKAKVKQLEENHENGFVQLEKLFEEKFKRFEERIAHMDNTVKNFNDYVKLLMEEIKKK